MHIRSRHHDPTTSELQQPSPTRPRPAAIPTLEPVVRHPRPPADAGWPVRYH